MTDRIEGAGVAPGTEEEGAPGPLPKGMLTDVTLCIGCERCVEACVRQNKLPRNPPGMFKAHDGLSGSRYTSIVEIGADDPDPTAWRAVRRHCMHCLEPTCAAACLVGAFVKQEDGTVRYDGSKCIGCRYCMLACPFMIPRYQYDALLPYMTKCKMDAGCRVEGGMPACVSACPTKATIFGPRDKLVEEAHRRIEASPGAYVDHVYGEHEFGGTSVLYLSDVPLHDTLRMPSTEDFQRMRVAGLATGSIAHMVHGWVLVTPFQFFTVSAALGGLWFLRRRQRIMAEEAAVDAPTDEVEG